MSQRQRSIFSYLLPISLPVLSALALLTKIDGALAIPLYPNDLSNNQVVRLQMEKSAPNGAPVTLNITPQFGFKNGGMLNTWIGADNDSLFKYLTNGYGINFQRIDSNYSISVKDTNVTPGNTLNTYQSGFGRYQDWNLEKVGGQYGDTYLLHWRTDLDTNLCLDIRGFGQGQQLNNQIPVVWYCDRNNVNQRIRVIKQAQTPPSVQPSNPTTPTRNPNDNYLPWEAGYTGKVDQAWGARTSGRVTHQTVPLALDFTVAGDRDVRAGNSWRSIVQARAIKSGVVEMAGRKPAYGNTVIIRHDNGTKSQYSHLDNISVGYGQRVAGGQNLGYIGQTDTPGANGQSNVHLHFQMMNANNQLIQFDFKDASGANFWNFGTVVTSQNR
jgi:murein DD-endopeptidase MepM/ murein hydrolase activator NlpD